MSFERDTETARAGFGLRRPSPFTPSGCDTNLFYKKLKLENVLQCLQIVFFAKM